jgi:hypothetical protein
MAKRVLIRRVLDKSSCWMVQKVGRVACSFRVGLEQATGRRALDDDVEDDDGDADNGDDNERCLVNAER